MEKKMCFSPKSTSNSKFADISYKNPDESQELVHKLHTLIENDDDIHLKEYLDENKEYIFPIMIASHEKQKSKIMMMLLHNKDALDLREDITFDDVRQNHDQMAMYLCLMNYKGNIVNNTEECTL